MEGLMTTKYLSLSEQDENLLLHLHRHVYLSKDFIEDHIYDNKERTPGSKRVYRRLKQLEDAGYIISFSVPLIQGSGRHSNIYSLNQLGVDTVDQLVGYTHWNKQWSRDAQIWYKHALHLAEVVKSFEHHAPRNITEHTPQGLEVKQFVSEGNAFFEYYEKVNGSTKPVRHVIRPDGILVVGPPNVKSGNVGIMLEMESSYGSRKGTIGKLEQYNHFFGRDDEEKFKNRMKKFDYKVGFEQPVDIDKWNVLFISSNGSMALKILQRLDGLESEAPLYVAPKEDLMKDPFGSVYRSLDDPKELTTL
jgi:DNA-binding PadR family transcriptional regulator